MKHRCEKICEQIPRGDSPLEEKAAAGSRACVRAACAFARDPSASRPLLAGANALRQPVTASRARDAIVASWLEAEALRRDGSGPDAARVALDGARAARSLQHVWLEVALLALAETAEPTGVHAQRASSILGRVSASLRRDADRSRLLSRWSFGGEDA